MTTTTARHRKPKSQDTGRLRKALSGIAAAGIVVSVLVVTDAFGAGSNGGEAVIATPTNEPLPSGGSQTTWTIKLPAAPADRCSGDSASNGYFVYSYITPAANPPGDLTFNAGTGPNQPTGSFAYPLFTTSGQPYKSRNTSPSDGQVIPGVQFNFNKFRIDDSDASKAPLPAGVYNFGIACWNANNNTQDKYWNGKITFNADASDPNGETWVAGDAPPPTTTTAPSTTTTAPPTTTSTAPGATTTTAPTTTTTTAPGTTTTTAPTTTTTAPPTTTTTAQPTTTTTRAPGSRRGTYSGHANMVTPANEPLSSGGSRTVWSFKLDDEPSGTKARCSGDSARDSFFVYSFITPFANNPADLTFNASTGPDQPTNSFAYSLFDTAGKAYKSRNTAPDTGQVMDFPTVQFDFKKFSIDGRNGTAPLPAGDYHVGIACWDAKNNVQDKFWDPRVTFTVSSSDPSGEVWSAQVVEPAPTTTTTAAPGATTTTTVGSGTTTSTSRSGSGTTTTGLNTTTTRNSNVGGGSPSGGSPVLPRTGGSVVTTLLFAAGLLYLGVFVLLAVRRHHWASMLGGRR